MVASFRWVRSCLNESFLQFQWDVKYFKYASNSARLLFIIIADDKIYDHDNVPLGCDTFCDVIS